MPRVPTGGCIRTDRPSCCGIGPAQNTELQSVTLIPGTELDPRGVAV